MKHAKRLTAFVLCLLLAACLIACGEAPVETVPPTTAPPPPPTAQEIYEQATQTLSAQDYVMLSSDITRNVAVGNETFTKTSQQQITWKGKGTDEVSAKIIDTSTIGDVSRRYSEVLRHGNVYLAGEGFAYISETDEEAFEKRWIGPVPLTMSNYETVTQETTDEGTIIQFSDATALEVWAAPEYARLQEASGSAAIDENGKLTGFTYCADFRQGGAYITLEVQIVVLENKGLDLTLNYAEDDERYVYVSDPAIPWLLMDAYDYVLSSKAISSYTAGTMSCEALGATCSQTRSVLTYGWDDQLRANVVDSVTVQTDRKEATHVWTHNFADGAYTLAYNTETPEPDDITAASMRNGCINWITELYPPMDYVTGATLTDFGSICLIELDCSVQLAQGYSEYLVDYMTDDPTLLNRLATSYKTTAMDYYVAINRDTGLPTACGINFGGTHTIDGQPYNMAYRMNQTIRAADNTVLETLMGEPIPEKEPAQKATPLLYKVTGSEGQQMWLMGTIHVGDERTGFLPQTVYDALDSSSALAVEFDTEDFVQMLTEDPELAGRVLTSYIYLDGTTAADHLDPMVYAAASKLVKAAGSSNSDLMLMKPYLWSQTIDGFYMEQGYNLSSAKGMDVRLMDYAREKEIEILNVESGIAQIEMLAGLSDAVQEMLLASSVSVNCADSIYAVEELYELWCAGDEARLIEQIQDDTSEMNKQELALYNEYNKAVSTDRNEGMLEVAKEYLESGDTVFYAVGLAHLLDNVNGLVNALREAGYTVELVEYQ